MTATAPSTTSIARRLLDVAPPVFAIIAEGAWISAVYAVAQAGAHTSAPLGVVGMTLAAGVGLTVARRYGASLGADWPRVATALVIGAALLGWLAMPGVIPALLSLDPGAAIRANPGGFLLGLAVLRGIAHVRDEVSVDALEHVVAWGLPGLVIPVLLAGALPEPWRAQAMAGVVIGILVFLVSGTMGLAMARQARIGGSAGFDWRRNRAWLGLVALLALGVVLAALPAALVVGPLVRVVLAATFLPLLAIGMLAGLGQVSLRAVVSLAVVGVVLLVVIALAPPAGDRPSDDAQGSGGSTEEATDSTVVAVAGGGLLVLAVVGGILVLARLWMREALKPVDEGVAEERTIDTGPPEQRTGGGWRPKRPARATGPPETGAEAYLALLHDLDPVPTRRRADAESPAEHARRLRSQGLGADGLDLLAADYALAAFGGRTLTPGEERRAVARWRRLRRALRQ
jgi:hypothetical protein